METEDVVFVLDPASDDVHADSARLRQAGSLVPVEVEGVRAWAATRHDTLAAVLTHPDLSRDISHWDPAARAAAPPDTAVTRLASDTSMLNAEGEAHHRLRAPVSKAFTARRVQKLRPRIAEFVACHLDRLAAMPPGVVDLRLEFAYPIPRDVISELMGVPGELRDELHKLTDVAARVGDTPDDVTDARRQLRGLLDEIIEMRRDTPGEDLITDLIAASEHDGADRLTRSEARDTVELLFIAGHVTTVNLITNASRVMLTHPDQLARVRSGEHPWSAVIEETMRWDSPIAHFPMRYAVRDLEIEGVKLRKGEAVLGCFASAGRDPDHYGERAERFDVTAPTPTHLSFGHGPHFCLGAPLARLEAEVALAALFEAFPDLTLAERGDGWRPLGTVLGNSTKNLPVLLGRRAA
ncbi:cytochrome P450 family protein [Nonomuraea africana]|uniref:Cytochrome P450 n=1 Tax=Nonomuraea africana TaxID=46171 RepID=A0ABR9KGN0_9ACTN|nr:cytochrome P450 [Nonomuraea africana]MBE1561169.1 cytochrome P450 [Nonomuraea africana]